MYRLLIPLLFVSFLWSCDKSAEWGDRPPGTQLYKVVTTSSAGSLETVLRYDGGGALSQVLRYDPAAPTDSMKLTIWRDTLNRVASFTLKAGFQYPLETTWVFYKGHSDTILYTIGEHGAKKDSVAFVYYGSSIVKKEYFYNLAAQRYDWVQDHHYSFLDQNLQKYELKIAGTTQPVIRFEYSYDTKEASATVTAVESILLQLEGFCTNNNIVRIDRSSPSGAGDPSVIQHTHLYNANDQPKETVITNSADPSADRKMIYYYR
jgi:hypothetical protein